MSHHHVQGENIWEECNRTFDRLPLSAVIDHEIFCIHGGRETAANTIQLNPLLVKMIFVRLYLIPLSLSLPSFHQAFHGQSQSMRQRLKPSCLSLL
jgi:diadenosine tetraphosphatase ApaH/serine/threonine PP2A family protein phosphatase